MRSIEKSSRADLSVSGPLKGNVSMSISRRTALRHRIARTAMVTATVVVAAMGLGSTAAHAELTLVPGSFAAIASNSTVPEVDLDGTTHYSANPNDLATQAGAHPFAFTTKFRFESEPSPYPLDYGNLVAGGNLKDLTVDLPAGFVGNPSAVPTCSQLVFNSTGQTFCPANTQIGIAQVDVGYGLTTSGLYNIAPSAGEPARIGFIAVGSVPVHLPVVVRSDGDYGLRVQARDLPQGLPVIASSLTIWGVPASSAHDRDRFIPSPIGVGGSFGGPSDAPRSPYLTNGTNCDAGPRVVTMTFSSWQRPKVLASASSPQPALTGCEHLAFDPTVSVRPDNARAGAPAGVEFDVAVPQTDGADTPATANLRDAVVTLPEGMAISPSQANGLEACSDEQFGLQRTDEERCPSASKIGTTTVDSPVLDEPLKGAIWVASQQSDDPASGQMFRIFVSAYAKGVRIKLRAQVAADPLTGQLTTTFADNPQLPFNVFTLSFAGGPRAALTNSPSCGTKTTTARFSSWAGQVVNASNSFVVNAECPDGIFAPAFSAGTVNPLGGAFSPLSIGIEKPDSDAALTGLQMVFPQGLLANLKGNVGRQVGTAKVAAGPGANPFWLSGPVVLEGAYGDAPFSLRVTVPAIAGPFNLGDVVVRQKIYVDPNDAHVTVVSDPLPTIVRGVPVRLQNLQVAIDKAGFMKNPTSCAPKELKGTLSSVAGQTAQVTNRFQVGGCTGLGYTPKLVMAMSGKGQTKDGSHPALTARLTPPADDANSKKVTVTLPLSLALDPGNANGLCEPKDAAANKCPANTIVGSAQAESILPDTLKGPVYFVRGERIENGRVRKTLPKLFIPVTANGVTVYVWGDSDVEDERLVTTFSNLPDAPFSTFDLSINGGKHGILAVSNTNTCAATQIADAEFGGQNGKAYTSKVTMGTPCGLGVVKSSRTSTALKLTVGGLGAGKVSASGNGVAKASKSLTSATTATLSLKLTKAARRALARGRDVKVKVKVAFTAKGQKKAKTATKTVVLHGAKKR
jgi:hypothetical protein